eukprot:158424-Chlamydomonas_euryale.AAC.1
MRTVQRVVAARTGAFSTAAPNGLLLVLLREPDETASIAVSSVMTCGGRPPPPQLSPDPPAPIHGCPAIGAQPLSCAYPSRHVECLSSTCRRPTHMCRRPTSACPDAQHPHGCPHKLLSHAQLQKDSRFRFPPKLLPWLNLYCKSPLNPALLSSPELN